MSDENKIPPEIAFEAWKYYGGIGGADKNTMITIVTWLLTASITIVGAYATDAFKNAYAKIVLAALGILVSGLATVIAVLYGGYSMRNWAMADSIANRLPWKELKADYSDTLDSKPSGFSALPFRFARSCENRLPFVFRFFIAVSFLSLLVHAVLFYLAFQN